MNDRKKLEEKAEDAFLALLMSDFAEREGEYYMAENERLQNDPSAAVPEDVDRRTLQIIEREIAKRNRRVNSGKLLHVLGRVMIAAAIAMLLFVAAYAVSPTVRASTLNILMQLDAQMASWQFDVSNGEDFAITSTNTEANTIVVDWVPEGYDCQPVIAITPTDLSVDLTSADGNLIRISVHASQDFIHTLDLEDADYYSDIKVQGCDGVLISKNDILRIAWTYNNTEFIVNVESSNVDVDTLLQVAESVHIVE